MNIQLIKINDLKEYENNPRNNDGAIEAVKESIKQFGFKQPIVIDENYIIIAGHTRYKASLQLGLEEVPCVVASDLTEEQVKAYRLADNKTAELAEWDFTKLEEELAELTIDMSAFGFEELESEFEEYNEGTGITLQEKFIVPPLTILDTRQGYWQSRKREWKDYGIKSDEGRSKDLMGGLLDLAKKHGAKSLTGTSIFDPVLCELMYKWFNIENGTILDPFAGGSVRGIVAHKLGYTYYGNDLRQEQIDANYNNAYEIIADNVPNWTCGDSLNIKELTSLNEYDMFFTCPPYADLEVYSDDERDISNMEYDEFIDVYKQIISNSLSMIKDNRFAVIVVGDVRDKQGYYRDFISHTKNIFIDNGFKLYNELVLVENISTAALRAERNFNANRKITKVHQNILVFYKGDIKQIRENYKDIKIDNLEAFIGEALEE